MSDRLDRARLEPAPWGARLELHDTIGSTNDRARELVERAGLADPVLILAEEQTAGRGRGSNRWWTGAGSLAQTWLVDLARWQISVEQSPLVSLALALATIEALGPRLHPQLPGLHWPNDVFASGRKLAGILVEVPRPGRYVLGLGINVNNSLAEAPPEVAARATSLIDLTGRAHDRTQLVWDLATALDSWLGVLGRDPAAVGRAADAACLQAGRELTVDTGFGRVAGTCRGIATDGGLKLETAQGLRTLYAGALVH